MKCKYCTSDCIRKGLRNGTQQYYCKGCRKYQRSTYKKALVTAQQLALLAKLNNEGMGIQSISRILKISASSVIRHIKSVGIKLERAIHVERNAIYEIDELQTYIGRNTPSNYVWITYAIHRESKAVVDFIVGKRTKENLKVIVDKVLVLQPKFIYTDGLNIYRFLIDKAVHKVQRFKINHIERKNLTLRTHIKRLNRRSICFSKSVAMLKACLMIYFFY